jgi:hypothetical protein
VVTATAKLQVARAPLPSVAVQVTGVLPDENVAPVAGVHVTVTPPDPPEVTGDEKLTATGAPLGDGTSTLAGQASVSGRGPGGGDVGEPPQPATATESIRPGRTRRRKGSMIDAEIT